MKKRARRMLFGSILLLAGIILLLPGSQRDITVFVDGTPRTVRTYKRKISSILKTAGVEIGVHDRVHPAMNAFIHDGQSILVEHLAHVHLTRENDQTFEFDTYHAIGGNILLDAGIRLYPGDQLYWESTPVQPNFNFSGTDERVLNLRSASVFTLLSEDKPLGEQRYGSGSTVGEVLMSAGVQISKSLLIAPDTDTPFVTGMSIEAVPLREITVAANSCVIEVVTAGLTVGEALSRAGMPLQGCDVSIPAAGERLPSDGRILIVPVRDEFRMTASLTHYETEWQSNDTLNLDETQLISAGHDGMKGTSSHLRWENGNLVLEATTPEQILAEAINEQREYGTKVNIQTLDTPDGPIEYWRSVPVYATSYSPCHSGTSGCVNSTASGAKLEKGVIAVSSAWYKQMAGQTVYVPGYGKAVIADLGGGIPGKNWIDLGYSDSDFVSHSEDTVLYFLTPVPANIQWTL